jgi:hypothetical protein
MNGTNSRCLRAAPKWCFKAACTTDGSLDA